MTPDARRLLRGPGRPARQQGRGGAWTAWRVTVALAASGGLAACGRAGLPDPATDEGQVVLDEWRMLLAIATVLCLVVVGLLVFAIVTALRRQRQGREPSANSGSTRWELTYTAIPVLIVAVVFAMSLVAGDRIAGDDPDPVVVEVTAFQWGWNFDYGDGVEVIGQAGDDPRMVLPEGRAVRLELRSPDVIHSFFVPRFTTKRDLVPGRTNTLDLTPSERGVYQGHCAEFCGLDHARMNFTVEVVSQDEFERWLQERRP